MKPFPWVIIAAAVSGVAGGIIGFATSSKGGLEFRGELARASRPDSTKEPLPTSAGRQPAFVNLPPQEAFARALAALLHGGKTETMAALLELLANRSLPPVAMNAYRNALVARLVELGMAKTLLEPGQFSSSDRQAIVIEVVRSLAKIDADAALAVMKNLSATERPGAASALLEQLGRRDPKRGLDLIEKDPALRDKMGSFFFGWAKVDPQAAAERVFGEKADFRDLEKRNVQMNVIAAWAGDDPDAAWKWISSQPGQRQRSAQDSWLSALAMTEPEVALDGLATKPELNNIMNSTMGQWIGLSVANNVAEAAAAVGKLSPGVVRTQLVEGLARSLSRRPRRGDCLDQDTPARGTGPGLERTLHGTRTFRSCEGPRHRLAAA